MRPFARRTTTHGDRGQAFAQRASIELVATGEEARTDRSDSRDQLTRQEEHIARLVRDDLWNQEIGAQAFIGSPTTGRHLSRTRTRLCEA